MKTQQMAVVDFQDYTQTEDPERRAAFVRALGESLEALGFVAVQGHGIPTELLQRGYALAEELFALPDAVKRQYADPAHGYQRGYTPFGLERARNNPTPDLKEFWHIGRELPEDHALTVSGDIPQNLNPAELPAFEATFAALYSSLERFGCHLLEAIATHLGQPPEDFRQMAAHGNSVLRIINYPDLGVKVPAGAVRAAAHEDINLLTVLPASTRPGLELLSRDGEWVSVETPPDVMICDTGDMMQLLTGGLLPSTTHRVVNPEGADGGRMSMPFFLHPNADFLLKPLRPCAMEPMLTRDFLFQRLRENGLA